MAAPDGDPHDESIGALFGRLAADGRAYVKAEIGLYGAIAKHRLGKARSGLIALAVAAVLLLAALGALVVGLVTWLAALIGPLLAGLAVAAAFLLVAGLLVRIGIARVAALGGDEEERAALARGEAPR